MNPSLRFGLRFLLVSILLISLANLLGDILVSTIRPLYRWEISAIDDHFRIIDLKLDNEGADHVIRLEVTLAKPVFTGSHFLMPDPRGRANSSTLIGNALQPLVLLFAMMFSWPIKNWRSYFTRSLYALPFCFFILMIDVPIVLLASLWEIILDPLAPTTSSPLMLWNHFLQGGGRLALGMAGGAVALWLANPMRHDSVSS